MAQVAPVRLTAKQGDVAPAAARADEDVVIPYEALEGLSPDPAQPAGAVPVQARVELVEAAPGPSRLKKGLSLSVAAQQLSHALDRGGVGGRPSLGNGVVNTWYRTISAKILVHDHYFVKYQHRARNLSIVLIILNSVVAGTSFLGGSVGGVTTGTGTSTGGGADWTNALQLLSGTVSTFAGIIAALSARLKYGELSEEHSASKRGYVRLKRRLDVLNAVRGLPLIVPAGEECEVGLVPGKMHPDWQAFLRDWDQVLNDSPPVGLATTSKVYQRAMHSEYTEMNVAELTEALS